jgi:hypothetical protein
MKKIILIAAISLMTFAAKATISFFVSAGDLRNSSASGTNLMSLDGLVILVASTTDSVFNGPTSSSFATGDDVVLYRGDLHESGQPGLFQPSAIIIDLSSFSGLNAGDPVKLFWFPTLTTNSITPGNGTSYGAYRDPVGNIGPGTGLDGSDPWYVQADGANINLNFITASEGGSNPDSAGYADLVVPEPGHFAVGLFAVGLCAHQFIRQRRRPTQV